MTGKHPLLALALGAGMTLTLASPVSAQEPGPDPLDPAAPAQAASNESLERRLEALTQEMRELRKELDEGKKDEELSGWQLQLRGGWFTLAHNHRDHVFSADDHQHGWAVGVGLVAPLWEDLGPIDLLGHLSIDYRQTAYSTTFTAPITGAKGTMSYLNIIVAPMIRFEVNDLIRPFVLAGLNMQVSSPPQDAITYLDLGAVLGLGVDIRLHERVSLGVDYKYSWFGVGDQEEEDYGLLGAYLGFNF